jgi:hypothetical protein
VAVLGRGQAPVDLRQPRIRLEIRERAVKRGAVDFVLPVRQVTPCVGHRADYITAPHG